MYFALHTYALLIKTIANLINFDVIEHSKNISSSMSKCYIILLIKSMHSPIYGKIYSMMVSQRAQRLISLRNVASVSVKG